MAFPIDVSFTEIPYPGLIGVAIIANIFPGVPEEIFLLTFGYFANVHSANFSFWPVVLFLIIGFCIIDSIIYFLAVRGNRVIYFITNKILGIELTGKEEFLRSEVRTVIFVSRFLANFRIIGPVTAALVRYPYQRFMAINIIALCIYVPLVMGIGYYFADRVENILSGAHVVRNVMLTVLAIILFFIVIRRLHKLLMGFLQGDSVKKIKSFLGVSEIDPDAPVTPQDE